MTNFYYLYGYLPYRYFYFKKSLRTLSTTTALCIKCGRLVTSTTALGVSAVPTGYFIKKNMFFRSPGRTYDNDAFNVDPDGDVVNDYWPVGRSYGR